MAELPDIALLKHGILSKNPQVKNISYKALLSIAREHPVFLYPDWDFFASLIEAERGADTKYIGIYLLAELTSVDTDNKFQRLFDKFYALLDDNSIIPASHAALTSGRISRHLPSLAGKITERLLAIDETHHKAPRRELIKSYVIQAIEEYFESLSRKQMRLVMEFVSRQQKSPSPKTAKIACQFLKTHPAV
jgi:hypothetical protein